MNRILKLTFLLSFVILTVCSCSKSRPINISGEIKTDISCYDAAEKNEITVKNISVEEQKKLEKYGAAAGCFDSKIFYINNIDTEDENKSAAELIIYDIDSGELSILCNDKNDTSTVKYSFISADERYIYFFRTFMSKYDQAAEKQLCRADLDSGEITQLHVFSNASTEMPVFFNGDIYFGDGNDIYKYDEKAGKTTLYKEDAKTPLVYGGELVYLNSGRIFGDDKVLFEINKENEIPCEKIRLYENIAAYIYPVSDDNNAVTGSVFGIFDKNFDRRDIASSAEGSFDIFSDILIFDRKIAIMTEKYPIIYDVSKNTLSRLITDGDRYKMFVSGDTLIIFSYVSNNGKVEKDSSPTVYYIR